MRIEGNASSSLQNLNVEKTNIVIDGNADLNAVFKDAGEAEATINGNASINLSELFASNRTSISMAMHR